MKQDRENSNIYHSVDNLHIATRDPSPPPFNRMKAEKQYHWRISKREMDVLPKIPPREPIDMKPYIPKPEQALPPVTARQPMPVPLMKEKPRTENRSIATELTSVLNNRRMAENTVPNQKHIPSNPEKINVPNVLPMVKTTLPSITRIQPPQMPKTNPPMQKLATVTNSFRRTPKERAPTPPPSSHDSSKNSNTSFYYSNETEDWNYEELKNYPIYTNK
ncbi:PREDICTED: verprolin-like [Papilio polytes]|uniref:verprolin-like n=1 Tax=Papilio polytes TaxID=76194 RepID=UPI000676803F|nr:PREDICTED: verprolin-like [Papilio polytes]